MRVSIIIPALNEAQTIRHNVERAVALHPAEVVVVDGASSDDTASIARAAGARVSSSPRGRALQQNAGARLAVGDILLFLHADTWLAEGALSQVYQAMENPAVQHGAFRQQIDDPAVVYRWLERGNAARVRWRNVPYGDQGIFIRRELFERLGGFPAVPLMEDWLLMRQMRRVARPVLLPGPLHVSARRWQQHGVVRQTLRNWSLITAARLGVSPARLASYYLPHGMAPENET
jgi:rSAM/selenodomain-associated transferase 2